MKVKELKAWLDQFQDDEEIMITSMDDEFMEVDFALHSPYDSYEQAQEIILPYYFERYLREGDNPDTYLIDLTGKYIEE